MSSTVSESYIKSFDEVVHDYILYRLRKEEKFHVLPRIEKFSRVGFAVNTVSPSVKDAVRHLAFEFEKRYRDSCSPEQSNFPSNAAIAYDSQDARMSFEAVASELFLGGWRWARVIALISYIGLLVDATASVNHSEFVEERLASILEWTHGILQSPEAVAFFAANNGWDGFVEWYKNSGSTSNFSSTPLPQQIAVVGLAAAAMVGLSFVVGRIIH